MVAAAAAPGAAYLLMHLLLHVIADDIVAVDSCHNRRWLLLVFVMVPGIVLELLLSSPCHIAFAAVA